MRSALLAVLLAFAAGCPDRDLGDEDAGTDAGTGAIVIPPPVLDPCDTQLPWDDAGCTDPVDAGAGAR